MLDPILFTILISASLVVIAISTSVFAFRVGAPLLLVFLIVGLGAGEDGIGGIEFDDARLAYFVGSVALAVILFDSGIGTSIHTFRVAATPAIVLATLGVVFTAALVAIPVRILLGVDWLQAILLGGIVGSTDAAAVFFLMRVGGIQIRERVRATLEIESASNDPMAIFLTVTLVEAIVAGMTTPQDFFSWNVLSAFVTQMGLGLTLGLASGYLVVKGVNWVRLEPGLYPVAIVAFVLAIFGATSLLGGSGFLAVYVAGLVMGNMRFRGGLAFRGFREGLTWLAQITMFLVLGLLATPSEIMMIGFEAVAIGLFLIFFGRPIAVWLCLLPFGFRRNESAFIAWVGLRGAVSILLAIVPIVGALGTGQVFFNVAFIIVLTSLLVQGWTIRPFARWLGLIVPQRIGPVEKVELELPGDASHELIAYRIGPESPVAQGERIPRWARPSLVVRNGRSMRLHDAGPLQAGDYVYIFVAPRFAALLDRLFARPAETSDRDVEYFGEFVIDPAQKIGDVAQSYGCEVADEEASLSVGEYFARRLNAPLARGDRLLLSPVELIVREADEHGQLISAGLALEPAPTSIRKIPIFHSYREIVAWLQTHLRRTDYD